MTTGEIEKEIRETQARLEALKLWLKLQKELTDVLKDAPYAPYMPHIPYTPYMPYTPTIIPPLWQWPNIVIS